MMSDYKVSDLGHHGHRHIHGVCYLAKWLDRALASLGWQTSFPEDYVETLCRLHFDHSPIILRYGDRLDWVVKDLVGLKQPELPIRIIRILFAVLGIKAVIMSCRGFRRFDKILFHSFNTLLGIFSTGKDGLKLGLMVFRGVLSTILMIHFFF